MKIITRLLLPVLAIPAIILSQDIAHAQVSDLGISFTKRGYIQDIAPTKGLLLVNYVADNNIYTEILSVGKTADISIDGKRASIDQLTSGMELNVTGDFFESKNQSDARKVEAKSNVGEEASIEGGRIDGIKGEFLFTDGARIKLAPGVRIKGAKSSGYDGRSFGAFSEIKLGDYIDIEGEYAAGGYILAKKVTIAPYVLTDEEQAAIADLGDFKEHYYSTWSNPATRSSMYGMPLYGNIHVVSNSALQNYISNLGMSLVPDYVDKKLHCMFIVIDDPEPNAGMQANGVCFVNVGLLPELKNEAQLAAILGHEITHALYEHMSDRRSSREAADKRAKKREKISRNITSAFEKYTPKVTIKDKQGRTIFSKNVKSGAATMLIKDLPNAKDVKRLSDYSIDNELQADRVGLYLMTRAGYDPREAAIVWKNFYAEDRAQRQNKKVEKKEKALPDPLKTQGDIADLSSGYIGNAFQRKVDALNEKKKETHPDDQRRFEQINRLVGEFYNNPQELASTKTGAESYRQHILPYFKALYEEQKRAEEQAKIDAKRRPLLDKQFKEAVPKKKERLAALTKPILSYKGYDLRPIVNVMELAGKQNCSSKSIKEGLMALKGVYDLYVPKVIEVAQKLKNGEIEPHEKDNTFVQFYLLSKGLNELVIDVAASASICDAEGVYKNIPTPDDINEVINSVSRSDEYARIMEFMKGKN